MVSPQLPLAVSLPDDETFESFIGETNFVVKQLLEQFVLAKTSATGFYLFGSAASGKSHLLHASSHFAAEQQLTSLCLNGFDLIELPVAIIEDLESLNLVCIDDIQAISDSKLWQQAIFDLFNRLDEQGNKLLISGNNSIPELKLTLPDLSSRLSWGHVEQLKALSDEEKQQALQHRAKQRGLLLADDICRFMVSRLSRNMTDLIAALAQLDKLSMQEQRKITIPFIKQFLLDNQ